MSQSSSAVQFLRNKPVLGQENPKPNSAVKHLLRELIAAALENTPPAVVHDDEHILLDIELDDCRYILLKTRARSSAPQLSPREIEIARMVAKGYPNKIIAAVLDISAWTVCTHMRRVFAKLGVSTRAAMVARLLEDELVPTRPQPERTDRL